MNKSILILALILGFGAAALADNRNTARIGGLWMVDYDRTMLAAKKGPKYDEKTEELTAGMVKSMMSRMQIRITDTHMIYLRGGKEIALPYAVSAFDDATVTISVKKGEQSTAVVFTLIDGGFMNFKSEASDDMNYYVWKKAATEEQE